MARPTFASQFLKALHEQGGSAGNPALRAALEWSEEKYWRVHQELCDAGAIARGRGRGGTVIIKRPTDQSEISPILDALNPNEATGVGEVLAQEMSEENSTEAIRELDLYEPLKDELVKFLKTRKGLHECGTQVTALQGRRETGGSWSRPDLVAVGVRIYEYLPTKSVELHSFEVKASYDVSVKGVLEALSHRESATHSHVVYHTDGEDWDSFPEARRIEQLAARHGVGVIVATSTSNLDDWDELVTASRSNADPEVIDRAIGALSDQLKSNIRKWTR